MNVFIAKSSAGLAPPTMGAHMAGRRCRSRTVLRLKWPTAWAVLTICCISLADPAAAYRPFDGTDAAVADVGEVEIEFQPIGAIRAGQTKEISDAILNFGFAERWELVLQATPRRYPKASVRSAFRMPHS